MLYGQKANGKALTAGELRALVKQLDAAEVPDAAVVRGRVRIGNRVLELSVESGECLREDVGRSETGLA